MSHPNMKDLEYFERMFEPVIGRKILGIGMFNNGVSPIITIKMTGDWYIDLQSDAEGNAGGWPNVIKGGPNEETGG